MNNVEEGNHTREKSGRALDGKVVDSERVKSRWRVNLCPKDILLYTCENSFSLPGPWTFCHQMRSHYWYMEREGACNFRCNPVQCNWRRLAISGQKPLSGSFACPPVPSQSQERNSNDLDLIRYWTKDDIAPRNGFPSEIRWLGAHFSGPF